MPTSPKKCSAKISITHDADGKYLGHEIQCENKGECVCVVKRMPEDDPATTYYTQCVCVGQEPDQHCSIALEEINLRGDEGGRVQRKVVCRYPFNCPDGERCNKPLKVGEKVEIVDGVTRTTATYICDCVPATVGRSGDEEGGEGEGQEDSDE